MFNPLQKGNYLNFPYPCESTTSCSPYIFMLSPGEYFIELWGASGGDVITMQNGFMEGGRGGFISGTLSLKSITTLYAYIGAQGTNQTCSPSFNGGGSAPACDAPSSDPGRGSSGGGGTDLRILRMPEDDDKNKVQNSLLSRFAVAGAGGGATSYLAGARGGSNLGLKGAPGSLVYYTTLSGTAPTGGTQTGPGQGNLHSQGSTSSSPGALGVGGDTHTYGAGAGGGGYYGGGSGGRAYSVTSSGAGGSSFLNGHSGCKLNSSLPALSNTLIKTGATSFLSPEGSYEVGHRGNGYVRIRIIRGSLIKHNSCKIKPNSIKYIVSFLMLL